MLIPLYLLSISFLFVQSVKSVDYNRNKRMPQRHTQITRSNHLNHPPNVEKYQIPVAVIYDDPEVTKVRFKNNDELDIITMVKNIEKKQVDSNKNSGNVHPLALNPPYSRNLFPFTGIQDYEEISDLKPKARSIKITESDETNLAKVASSELENSKGTKTRRRTQQVRKIRVDKVKMDEYVNERKNSENKASKAEDIATTTELIHKKEHEPHVPQVFQRRMKFRDPVVPIVDSESYVFSHSGDFHYSYESGDGTKAYEKGVLKSSNGGAGSAVEGNFSYKDKDGKDFSLSYTADENGYRPVGDHLPTPPPIPPEIQRALEYLATKSKSKQITERPHMY